MKRKNWYHYSVQQLPYEGDMENNSRVDYNDCSCSFIVHKSLLPVFICVFFFFLVAGGSDFTLQDVTVARVIFGS